MVYPWALTQKCWQCWAVNNLRCHWPKSKVEKNFVLAPQVLKVYVNLRELPSRFLATSNWHGLSIHIRHRIVDTTHRITKVAHIAQGGACQPWHFFSASKKFEAREVKPMHADRMAKVEPFCIILVFWISTQELKKGPGWIWSAKTAPAPQTLGPETWIKGNHWEKADAPLVLPAKMVDSAKITLAPSGEFRWNSIYQRFFLQLRNA